MPEHSTILAKMEWAAEYIRNNSELALMTAARPLTRQRLRSAGVWFASLFARDGRAMEFFSGAGLLGWAWLTDLATDLNLLPPSLGAARELISPDAVVWLGYALGAAQLGALASLHRPLRAVIAALISAYMGVLTQGVLNLTPSVGGGGALYAMAWAMNVYIFIRLCQPRA